MADIKVPGLTADNAVLLLEAAEVLEMDPSVVRTTDEGHFIVPEEVAEKAGLAPAETTTKKRRTARSGSGKDED